MEDSVNYIDNTSVVLYTSDDLRGIFKCGKNQVYELLHTNGFPTIRIGNKMYVEKTALENWLVKNRGKHIKK